MAKGVLSIFHLLRNQYVPEILKKAFFLKTIRLSKTQYCTNFENNWESVYFLAGNPFRINGRSEQYVKSAFQKASNSTRLVVVRHPLNRLFSGFKFIHLTGYIHWLQKFRQNVTNLKRSGVPLLESYVRHLLKSKDIHFWTYEESCFPCDLDYTAIVKMDQMGEMKQFFAESSVFDSHISNLFLASNSTVMNESRGKSRSVSWKDYFSGLTPETWIKMLQHYRNDFIHFDYYLYYCQ